MLVCLGFFCDVVWVCLEVWLGLLGFFACFVVWGFMFGTGYNGDAPIGDLGVIDYVIITVFFHFVFLYYYFGLLAWFVCWVGYVIVV